MQDLVCRANLSRGTSEQQESVLMMLVEQSTRTWLNLSFERPWRVANEALRTGTWVFCILSTEQWTDSSVERRNFLFWRSSSPYTILHADISARCTSDGSGDEVCLVTSTFSRSRHLSFIGRPSLPRQAVGLIFVLSSPWQFCDKDLLFISILLILDGSCIRNGSSNANESRRAIWMRWTFRLRKCGRVTLCQSGPSKTLYLIDMSTEYTEGRMPNVSFLSVSETEKSLHLHVDIQQKPNTCHCFLSTRTSA